MTRQTTMQPVTQLTLTIPETPLLREGQFLGRGSEKLVKVTSRNGMLVAVMSSETVDLEPEARLMKWLSQKPHPHLLPLLAEEFGASSKVVVLAPIAKFGSVLDLADSLDFDGRALTADHVKVIVHQVSEAIAHLSSLGIDHADVRARNVLVFDFDMTCADLTHVKLADFGSARSGRARPSDLERFENELNTLLPQAVLINRPDFLF